MAFAPKTIVIADDHPIFRVGVVSVLNRIEGYKVIGEAENGLEAIDLIVKHKPDIAILDLDMPKSNGINVVNRIVELHLPTRMVILTAHTDPKTFMQIAEMQEVSILLKENAINELPQCLQSISEGKVFISQICRKVISKFQQQHNSVQKIVNRLKELTSTEIRILSLIGEGLTTQQIADRQSNSFKTIENHRTNIANKLDISGANNLLVFAVENKELISSALGKKG
jgi:DNA-binding NarL/FixJ family response regulator